jgi:hypothetical protein
MTSVELWAWWDALAAVRDREEHGNFFLDWAGQIMDEITQGRPLIANVGFDGGLVLAQDNELAVIYGCEFKNIVSAYPLKLA